MPAFARHRFPQRLVRFPSGRNWLSSLPWAVLVIEATLPDGAQTHGAPVRGTGIADTALAIQIERNDHESLALRETMVQLEAEVLRDLADHRTQKFMAPRGEANLARAIGWFGQSEGTAEFACQDKRSPDGWTGASDRSRPLFTRLLSLMPRLESRVSV